MKNDLGQLRYFLSIEMSRSGKDVNLSRGNMYMTCYKIHVVGAKPATLPINPFIHLCGDYSKVVDS